MKKFLPLLLILALAFPNTASAAKGATPIVLFSSVTINGTATATSVAIPIKSAGFFGVWYQAVSSASAPDLKIQYEMSYDSTPANFAVPVGASDIVTNLTAETIQIESIQPPPMAYIRIKVTGNAGNASDTVLNLRLFIQEP